MYVTGPPSGARAGTGLRLRRAEHRVYPGDSASARHPALRPYLADLAGKQGVAVREEVFAAGAGQSFTDMALPLVDAVTVADEPVDLLVLAYGMHDVQPGRNAALRLARRCPGDPLAFAITDQGTAAVFAGLRVIGDHVATGGCGRALLVVAEQAAVHYELAEPAPVPDRHAAAVLLFEAAPDAPQMLVRQHPGVPVEAVGAVLTADLTELAGDRTDVTFVAGTGLAGGFDAGTIPAGVREVRHARAGLPYTGLAGELDGDLTDSGGLLVLADHDPVRGHLGVAAFRTAASTRPSDLLVGALPHRPEVRDRKEV
jgi:hypothetical protein